MIGRSLGPLIALATLNGLLALGCPSELHAATAINRIKDNTLLKNSYQTPKSNIENNQFMEKTKSCFPVPDKFGHAKSVIDRCNICSNHADLFDRFLRGYKFDH